MVHGMAMEILWKKVVSWDLLLVYWWFYGDVPLGNDYYVAVESGSDFHEKTTNTLWPSNMARGNIPELNAGFIRKITDK